MAYKAYIVELPEPRKHTNADRLQCFEVYGQNVITDLKYHEGQKCVYFPVDGQLSERFCEENNLLRKKDADGNNIGGYMDPSKRNITAIRLRKEKSEGLVLPIEVLSPYCDVTKLVVGQAISEFGDEVICRKYIPIRRNQRGNGGGKRDERKKKVKTTEFPFFEPHVDTEQLAYNQDAFHEGDLVYLTRKLHGTSFRVGNTLEEIHKKPTLLQRILHPTRKEIVEKKWKVVGGTRKVILDDDYSGGYYGSNEFRKKYTEQLAPILPKGVTIYGELVGYVNDSTPIMPVADVKKVADKDFRKRYGDRMVFDYGCEPGESHAYRHKPFDVIGTEYPSQSRCAALISKDKTSGRNFPDYSAAIEKACVGSGAEYACDSRIVSADRPCCSQKVICEFCPGGWEICGQTFS